MDSIWELANPNLKTLVPYEPGKPIDDVAREFGLDPASIIKLASNENPLGPSPRAVEALLLAAHRSHLYPDGGGFHLRNAIAQRLGTARENIVLGNGSNEIIQLAYHAFVKPGRDSAVASRYAFVVYKLMAELFGAAFLEAPDRGFHHDLAALRATLRPDTRLVFLANPNNPTGTRIPNTDLESFLADLPPHCVAVLDEAYYEFLDNPPPSVEWALSNPRLIVARTCSKIHGLAALRIGYAVAHASTAEILQRCRQPFNVNALAQAAALAAFDDTAHMDKTRRLTAEGRTRLEAFCRQHSFEYLPSQANFVLFRVGNADAVFRALMQRGIIVRSMVSYGLPEWIRVSIGLPAQMERFEQELLHVLGRS
jgi:histidinol-phosphate aminotransferase